jgi:hypothetical protein
VDGVIREIDEAVGKALDGETLKDLIMRGK